MVVVAAAVAFLLSTVSRGSAAHTSWRSWPRSRRGRSRRCPLRSRPTDAAWKGNPPTCNKERIRAAGAVAERLALQSVRGLEEHLWVHEKEGRARARRRSGQTVGRGAHFENLAQHLGTQEQLVAPLCNRPRRTQPPTSPHATLSVRRQCRGDAALRTRVGTQMSVAVLNAGVAHGGHLSRIARGGGRDLHVVAVLVLLTRGDANGRHHRKALHGVDLESAFPKPADASAVNSSQQCLCIVMGAHVNFCAVVLHCHGRSER